MRVGGVMEFDVDGCKGIGVEEVEVGKEIVKGLGRGGMWVG